MTRTAVARALPIVLAIIGSLSGIAAIPGHVFAQAPEGAGTSQFPQIETPPQQAAQDQPSKSALPSIPVPEHRPPKERNKSKSSLPPVDSKAPLAQLAWLAGRWQGDWGPRVVHQAWLPPQSGVMVGVFQETEGGQTKVVELYTIVATDHGIELRIRHFTPTLTAWERSGQSRLKLMTYDSKSFLFVNEGNGQPKKWLMRRSQTDTYINRIEVVPEKGERQNAEIVYHRASKSGAANH